MMRTDRQPRHIVFATSGSLGDLYPFLALGCELRRRGHRVTIATSANHRSPIIEAGLEFRHMRPDPENTPAFHARYMHPKTSGEFVYREYLGPAIRQSYDDLTKATADADLLVSQSLMALAAPLVADKTGIAWASAILQPMSFFSVHERPNYLPFPVLPWMCGRSSAFHEKMLFYVRKHTVEWVKPVLEFRQQLGIVHERHPMYEGQHSPHCVLAMFSPLLGQRQPDWPASSVQTGTALYSAAAAALPAELEAFLSRSSAPLAVFTLSGAASNDAGNFYVESLEAARSLGVRALLMMGGLAASSPLPEPLPDWAFRIAYAPFEQVFPHADVVIHAGGIGTAFRALQAEAPQIIVPHAHDQLDNGLRLEKLGIARVIRGKRASRRSLAKSIGAVLEDAQMRRKVVALAAEARREDGAIGACDVIERMLDHA